MDRAAAYAEAALGIARAEGHLSGVEEELFRFARAVEANDELRMSLSDRALPLERRLAVVEDLLAGKALSTTIAIVELIVSAGRANQIVGIIDQFIELAAQERKRGVAEVRTAVELDANQKKRLAEALGKVLGMELEVRVTIDPSVLGGIYARVGDVVIDGSVRGRLAQLKAQVG